MTFIYGVNFTVADSFKETACFQKGKTNIDGLYKML